MKIMISGSRTATEKDYKKMADILDGYLITEILHGGANGFDALAERYAKKKGIKTTIIKPDYKKYAGKVAPLMRNIELVNLADFVFCFYDCEAPSRTNGTHHTAKTAAKAKKLKGEFWTKQGPETMLF